MKYKVLYINIMVNNWNMIFYLLKITQLNYIIVICIFPLAKIILY